EPLLNDALAMTKLLFAGDHPNVATSLNNLAVLYQSLGRYSDAEPLLNDALAMFQRVFAGVSVSTITLNIPSELDNGEREAIALALETEERFC
ncbi:MAG: tetratricopeptide repeat protein, partial [Nostoc sp.]